MHLYLISAFLLIVEYSLLFVLFLFVEAGFLYVTAPAALKLDIVDQTSLELIEICLSVLLVLKVCANISQCNYWICLFSW